jgi:hypothetical protein
LTPPPPTAHEYIEQAAHNAALAAHLRSEKPDYLDWAVTCLFYSALHYVNAYLAFSQKPIPKRHRATDGSPARLNIIQQDPNLRPIYPHYRHLDDESRDARYELRKPTRKDYDDFLLRQLQEVQNYLVPKITS